MTEREETSRPTEASADGARVVDLEIVNEKGLHARASALFASTVEEFDAKVTVSRQDLTVNGESIMGLLMLTASKGSTIRVCVEGNQADEALSALRELVANRFGEPK